MNEASMHDANCFITLTYDDQHAPLELEHRHWQLFAKRLRKQHGPFRYFMSGEYGSLNQRPHFHALLFGLQLPNNLIESTWGMGFTNVGDVTRDSAGYVAKYTTKSNKTFQLLDPTTGELTPAKSEYGRMSLKPGIGHTWFQKYWKDIYGPRDGIVLPGGMTISPPRYYDKLMCEQDPTLYAEKETQRELTKLTKIEDMTPQRMTTREQVHKARMKLKRTKL